MLNAAERPLIVAGGGVINADACGLLVEFAELTGVPVMPTLMGWGSIPDDHDLMAGMVGLQTSTATATRPSSNRTSCSASATAGPTAIPARPTSTRTAANSFTSISSRPRSAACSAPTSALSPMRGKRSNFPRGGARVKAEGKLKDRSEWVAQCLQRKRNMLRRSHFDRSRSSRSACLRRSMRPRSRHLLYHGDRPWADRWASFSTFISRATGSFAARPGRSAGRFRRRLASCRRPRSRDRGGLRRLLLSVPDRGARGRRPVQIPYLDVLVNNSYLGLIRQAQRGYHMDFEVSLAFDNVNSAPRGTCLATVSTTWRSRGLRLPRHARESPKTSAAFACAQGDHGGPPIPVVLEFILERITNISMGPEIEGVNEFEEILCLTPTYRLGRARTCGPQRKSRWRLSPTDADAASEGENIVVLR